LKQAYETKTDGRTLQSYLILPIQRLPRYELLLNELLKFTEQPHVDYENIQVAYAVAKKINQDINSRQKEDQTVDHIKNLLQKQHSVAGKLLHSPRKTIIAYLKITVISAKDLFPMDHNGLADPFVVIDYAKSQHKTTIKKKTLNPEWNEEFALQITNSHEEAVMISVKDWDRVGKNTLIGDIEFSISSLKSTTEETPNWYTLKPSPKLKKRLPSQGSEVGEINLSFLYKTA